MKFIKIFFIKISSFVFFILIFFIESISAFENVIKLVGVSINLSFSFCLPILAESFTILTNGPVKKNSAKKPAGIENLDILFKKLANFLDFLIFLDKFENNQLNKKPLVTDAKLIPAAAILIPS